MVRAGIMAGVVLVGSLLYGDFAGDEEDEAEKHYESEAFLRGETHLVYLLQEEVLQVLATTLEKYF